MNKQNINKDIWANLASHFDLLIYVLIPITIIKMLGNSLKQAKFLTYISY